MNAANLVTNPEELAAYGLDRVVRLADGAYLLVCPASKGWTARRGGSQTRASHPGAAVRWADRIFEVAAADPQADGGTRYRLEPWDDRHAIRVVHPYDEASEAARGQEQTSRARSGDKRLLSILFSPILGHLPGAVQHRMETEFGAPARGMTVISALPVFAVGFLGLFGQLLGFVGAAGFLGFELPLPLAAYLTAESALRIGSAWVGVEPMGSAAGVLLFRAAEIVAGRRLGPAPAAAPGRAVGPEERLDDRFHMLEPFLALLPEADQRLLVRELEFDALRWGRVTVAVLLVVGALNVVASALSLASDLGGAADAVWLVAGVAICAEQVVRGSAISRKQPRGSVFGVFVRPFARPLLEPRPVRR